VGNLKQGKEEGGALNEQAVNSGDIDAGLRAARNADHICAQHRQAEWWRTSDDE